MQNLEIFSNVCYIVAAPTSSRSCLANKLISFNVVLLSKKKKKKWATEFGRNSKSYESDPQRQKKGKRIR